MLSVQLVHTLRRIINLYLFYSMNLNKALVAGNLTRDPELKSLPSGQKVANFGIATNRYWKDPKSGERKEATEFHNIVVFGRSAEVIAQYMKKGSGIFVEGRLQTRSWEAEGQKKYRTEIIADRFEFVGTGARTTTGGAAPVAGDGGTSAADASQIDVIEYPEDDINPEDIPF
jgi:single-strand DNA-binding protein